MYLVGLFGELSTGMHGTLTLAVGVWPPSCCGRLSPGGKKSAPIEEGVGWSYELVSTHLRTAGFYVF